MTFTELPFVYFFVAAYGLWLLCRRSYQARLLVLLAASIVFYGYHHWWLLGLLLAYCLVNWAVGCWIERGRRPKLALTLGVGFNLTVLAYWKYTPLLLRSVAALALALDLPVSPPAPDNWAIPFGISFYTFTGIAYMVDVYRRTIPAEPNLLRFALFKTFFPQLVAGPILRAQEFLAHLQPEQMPDRAEAPLEAALLVARGFFKKMVLADRIALAIDPYFVHIGDASTAGVWALPYVYLYALQIYFDFSGYTDIARGLGLWFGFRWPDNFNLPYLAQSVQDFWHRWHITLSQFLKDYLYIPLGGNRQGAWQTQLNLMLTMLLGGLWHGASWSFMGWGGLHGLALVVHGWWRRTALRGRLFALTGLPGLAWRSACLVLTFHWVCLAWCFFRLTAFADSLVCVQRWFCFDSDKLLMGGSGDRSLWLLLGLYGLLVWASRRGATLPALIRLRPAPVFQGFVWGTAVMLLVLAVLLTPAGEKPPFIYFQF
jgi:D-alanyl-lipoteichoic acid acyltransferase DltB (MBOAT superfamily)